LERAVTNRAVIRESPVFRCAHRRRLRRSYERPRYEDTFGLGGVNGVRGIPGHRYYGRLRVFANLDLRSRIGGFTIADKPSALNAGRVAARRLPTAGQAFSSTVTASRPAGTCTSSP
jgi:hypothetical protein